MSNAAESGDFGLFGENDSEETDEIEGLDIGDSGSFLESAFEEVSVAAAAAFVKSDDR